MKEDIIKERYLQIVDLIANAKGIVDLATAEKIFFGVIDQKLQAQRQEIIEMVNKMVKYKDTERGGYNQALVDVITKIKERYEK